MRRRRILLAVTIDDSLQFLRGYPEYLVDNGWDVHVVSNAGPRLQELENAEGVWVHPIRMARSPAPLSDLVALLRWVILIWRIHPDAVSVGTPKAGLLGITAAFLNRVPVRIYLLRGLRLETSRGFRRQILIAVERFSMSWATHVLAVSNSLRDQALAMKLTRSGKIRVVGHGSSNGVDVVEFDPARFTDASSTDLADEIGLRPGVCTIGFVGRLTRDKGLHVLVEALQILSDRGIECQLLVLGGVDDKSGQQMLEGLHQLKIAVVVVGYVDAPARYYALMDIFCLPSFREGFANVVLEASSMAIPVVVSNATGMLDTIQEGRTGTASPVGDALLLATSLGRIASKCAETADWGRNGRQLVKDRFRRQTVQASYANDLRDLVIRATEIGTRE